MQDAFPERAADRIVRACDFQVRTFLPRYKIPYPDLFPSMFERDHFTSFFINKKDDDG